MLTRDLEGKRVVFTGFREPDPYSTLCVGTRGTVSWVDDIGTVHVEWDDGSQLGVFQGEFKEIER